MFGIGMGELIVILIILLLLFGARRLPDIARSLGKALQEFKKASSQIKKEIEPEEDVKEKEEEDRSPAG